LHALQRIAAGVYDRCESCGGKMSAARLNALPYTDRCIDCQREAERGEHSTVLEPDSTRWENVDVSPFEDGESDAQTNLRADEMDLGESRGWALDSPLVALSSNVS